MLQFWNRVKDVLLCLTDTYLGLLSNVLCLSSNASIDWFAEGYIGRSRRLQAITDIAHFLSNPVRYSAYHKKEFKQHQSIENDHRLGTLPHSLQRLCDSVEPVADEDAQAPGPGGPAARLWRMFLDAADVDSCQVVGLVRESTGTDDPSLGDLEEGAVEALHHLIVNGRRVGGAARPGVATGHELLMGGTYTAESARRALVLKGPGQALVHMQRKLQPLTDHEHEEAAISELFSIVLGTDAVCVEKGVSLEHQRWRLETFTGFGEHPGPRLGAETLELVRANIWGWICARVVAREQVLCSSCQTTRNSMVG